MEETEMIRGEDEGGPTIWREYILYAIWKLSKDWDVYLIIFTYKRGYSGECKSNRKYL